jgi:hypothetical protein
MGPCQMGPHGTPCPPRWNYYSAYRGLIQLGHGQRRVSDRDKHESVSRDILHSVVDFEEHCNLPRTQSVLGSGQQHNRNIPSQFPADTFFNRSTSDVDKYARTLSVAPLRIIVCKTISALKTIYSVTSVPPWQNLGRVVFSEQTYNSIRFPKARRKCFADIMNSPILRPGRGENGIQILIMNVFHQHQTTSNDYGEHTLDFGGAALGLQANLTTLS